MYEVLNELLKDKKTETVFSCFGIWHILYMLIIFVIIGLVIFLLKNKSSDAKRKAINVSITFAFCLYIADFFLMPFAYGEIDLEKLPFHMCTITCVLCFLSRHNKFLSKYKTQFAILGLISNIIYVIYPAGVGWYQIHPLCYRVVQTLLFHGAMSAYGIFVLVYDDVDLKWKNCYKELVIITIITLWALLGNTLYNGTLGDYDHFFNWFFVIQDPFYILPRDIAKYIMPFVMIIVIFIANIIVYAIYFGGKKWKR